MPLHPLVIHAVVVFAPLAALGALAMAVPKWRWLARWPTLLVTLGATAATYVATLTGQDLEEERGLESPLLKTHEEWGERLMIAMWIFAAVVIVSFWLLPHVTRLSGGRDKSSPVAALATPVSVLLVLSAVAVLMLVVLTGDAGAKAVWK